MFISLCRLPPSLAFVPRHFLSFVLCHSWSLSSSAIVPLLQSSSSCYITIRRPVHQNLSFRYPSTSWPVIEFDLSSAYNGGTSGHVSMGCSLARLAVADFSFC